MKSELQPLTKGRIGDGDCESRVNHREGRVTLISGLSTDQLPYVGAVDNFGRTCGRTLTSARTCPIQLQ